MATIAKGMITLTNVNDAYSVLATPNVCAIKADFDGSNPILNDAYCDISVLRGDIKAPFTISFISLSNTDIEYEITGDSYSQRFALTSIPINVSSGSVTIEIATEDGFVANAVFQYNVMREATMLDWIQDWETNKTSIGNTYLITPKLFVGKKVLTEEDLSVLTGVYVGPDSDKGAGIYGLKEGVDVFHVNEEGAMIGGWVIASGGIHTVDGTLTLLSEGSIMASDNENNVVWGIYKSGEATFAKGNVQFHSDGSAEFKGKITSSEGTIAGWAIDEGAICTGELTNEAGTYTAESGSVTIGVNGLRGYQWRLENDGSGALGGGKISWESDGTLNVGRWMIDEGMITSAIQSSSKYIYLDATTPSIKLYNNAIQSCYVFMDCTGIGDASKGGGYSSQIILDANSGMIEATSVYSVGSSNIIPTTRVSPFGISANYSGFKANENASSECQPYASIVGIGNAAKDMSDWNKSGEETCVVGVYGKANNNSTAPAYGGYFENLKACGLVLSQRVVTDEDDVTVPINSNETLMVSIANSNRVVTLPQDNINGKVVIVKRLGDGELKVTVSSDSEHILSGSNQNEGIHLLEKNECAVFVLTIYKQGGDMKYVWTINNFYNNTWSN